MKPFYTSPILLIIALMVSCNAAVTPKDKDSVVVTDVDNFKQKLFEISSLGGEIHIAVDNNTGYSLEPLDNVRDWVDCRCGDFYGSGDGDTIVMLVSPGSIIARMGYFRVVFKDLTRGCDTLTISQKAAWPTIKQATAIQGASALYVSKNKVSGSGEPYLSANVLSRIMPDGTVDDVAFLDEVGDTVFVKVNYVVNLSRELVYMNIDCGSWQPKDYIVRKSDGVVFTAANASQQDALITPTTDIQVDSHKNVYLNGSTKISVHNNTPEIVPLDPNHPYMHRGFDIINSNDDMLFYGDKIMCYNSTLGATNIVPRPSYGPYEYSSIFGIKGNPNNFYFLTTTKYKKVENTIRGYYTNLVRLKADYPTLSLDTVCRIQIDKRDILLGNYSPFSVLTCGQKTILSVQYYQTHPVKDEWLHNFLVFANESNYKFIPGKQGLLGPDTYVASDNYIYGYGSTSGTPIFRLDPESGSKETVLDNPNFNITNFSVSHDDVITFLAENSSDQTLILGEVRNGVVNILSSSPHINDPQGNNKIVRID